MDSRVPKPYCDASSQNTFYGAAIEINKSLGAQAKSLEAPQKVQSLLRFLKDSFAVKGPCKWVCYVYTQELEAVYNVYRWTIYGYGTVIDIRLPKVNDDFFCFIDIKREVVVLAP